MALKKGFPKLVLTVVLAVVAGMLAWTLISPASFFKKKLAGTAGGPGGKAGQGAGPAGAGQTEEAVQVKTYKIKQAPFEDILHVLGTVKGEKEVTLRFAVNGVVKAIHFREGDPISQGDVVAELDLKDATLKLEFAQSKLAASQAAAKTAQKKLEIQQKLFDVGAIIRAKLEEAQLEYESAVAQSKASEKEAALSQGELEKTVLKAPLDSVLGTRDAEVGEFVNPQTKIASLFSTGAIYVELGVIERDIQKVSVGQAVKVAVDAYPGTDFTGTVDNIPSIVEGKSRTLPVKVSFDNPEQLLKPGMFARAEVAVYSKENAIMVPVSAVFDSDGDGKPDSLFLVAEAGVAQSRKVAVGYQTSDFVEIEDGVIEGDEVIVETATRLQDGMKVAIQESQEPKVQ